MSHYSRVPVNDLPVGFEREQVIKQAVNKSRRECHDNIRTLNPDRDLRWDNEEAFDRVDRDYDRD